MLNCVMSNSLFTGGPQLLALWFSSQDCYFLQENLYKYEFIDQDFSLLLVDIESALFPDLI